MSKMQRLLIVVVVLFVFSSSCRGTNETTKALSAGEESTPTPQKYVPEATEIAYPTLPASPEQTSNEIDPSQKHPPVATGIARMTLPVNPGRPEQTSIEIDTSKTARKKDAVGDSFRLGIFERPFTESTMEYFKENDLLKLSISRDDNFFYIVIKVAGPSKETGYLSATYMVEFDTDMDGRGDVLLMAKGNSSPEWTLLGVSVLKDSNNDVGGSQPVLPDNNPGDGYDRVLFSTNVLTDPDSARQRTNGDSEIQLAIKKDLVGASRFMWKVWADGGLVDPARFDYNDRISEEEAGSPSKAGKFYPVGRLNRMDSTCWIAFNFEPNGRELGGCNQMQPKKSERCVCTLWVPNSDPRSCMNWTCS